MFSDKFKDLLFCFKKKLKKLKKKACILLLGVVLYSSNREKND